MSGNTTPQKYYGFKPERWGKSTKLVFENNFFGDNTVYEEDVQSGIFNFFELNCAVANGSKFNNNTFVKGSCSHNMINFYQVEDGTEETPTVIEVKNNVFDCAIDSNPIRIGCKGAPKNVEFYFEGNEYTPDPGTDHDWTGLFFIQPWTTETTDMGGISIYLKHNVINDDAQLFYYDAKPGRDVKLVTLDESLLPKVYLWDDSINDYRKLSVLEYLDARTYEEELLPLMGVNPEIPEEPITEGGE